MQKEFLHAPSVPAPHGHSHAVLVRADRLLFVSGQGPFNGSGEFVGADDFPTQLRQTLENIGAVLREANADFDSVVRYVAYVTDYEAFLRHHGVVEEVFGTPAPAGSVVQVVRLFDPRMMVQMDVVAAL